ncbi:hypothetical protein HispidOSU_002681, partial [Sigmodon hispidus]
VWRTDLRVDWANLAVSARTHGEGYKCPTICSMRRRLHSKVVAQSQDSAPRPQEDMEGRRQWKEEKDFRFNSPVDVKKL